MIRQVLVAWCLLLLSVGVPACQEGKCGELGKPSGTVRNPPALEVQIGGVHRHGSRVEFDWSISNHTRVRLYVYATHLNGPAAEWKVDQVSSVTEIYASYTRTSDASVNDYLPARFIRIDPGRTLKGRFSDDVPADLLVGSDRIRFFVAYGLEIRRLQRDLRYAFRHCSGHPLNPVVRWQWFSESNVAP